MKSPIILRNRNNSGFLTMEIMLAFSLMILFTLSTFTFTSSMQELKIWSLKELSMLKDVTQRMDEIFRSNFSNLSQASTSNYGDDTKIISLDPFSLTHSDYSEAWGRDTCYPRPTFEQNATHYFPNGVDIGAGNISTDLEVRNGIVYFTADASASSQKDFFIIDAHDPLNPFILSSLNTGPGLSAIEVAGPYAFVAQSSSVNQLQIIDIHDRASPQLISQLKLPLPTPTTTAPFATSIFYSNGYIYLGTAKWNGPEFAVIDALNPYDPQVVGTFETNTLINDIYVRGTTVYLAASDDKQMRILDVSTKNDPILVDSFSPSGWQTQEGKSIDYFEGKLGFGRTVGGFNVLLNHEAFIFSTSSFQISTYVSRDIPGGVYGMLVRPQNIFLLTHSINHEFQVWDSTLAAKLFDMPLGVQSAKMSCDGTTFFFATGNDKGISILKLYE